MHSKGAWLGSVIGAWLAVFARPARANEMDLQLSRLSRGHCERTLSGAEPLVLRADGEQTLRRDEAAWRALITQLVPALAPATLAPVTTSGPRGVDVSVQTRVTGISQDAGYWRRGSRGSGSSAVDTCDGANRSVSSALTATRLSFEKGLPLGVTIGVELGRLWQTSLWTIGGSLKLALVEGYPRLPSPDIAVRVTGSTAVGHDQYSLTTITGDLLLSKPFVLAQASTLAPFVGGGLSFSYAASELIDLTPNIDSSRCQQGLDPVCSAGGLGASRDDVGHEVPFPSLRLLRYHAVVGLMLRYRLFSLAAEMSVDLLAPDRADADAGQGLPRQWSLSVAPALSY